MNSTYDPRTEVTQHAFRVHPDLLGKPLARPWRRGVAMLLDGVALAVLTNAPGVVFGMAAALVLLKASAGAGSGGIVRRSARWATRATAAVLLFLVVLSVTDRLGPDDDAGVQVEAGRTTLSGQAGLVAGAELLALRLSDDEGEARRRGERLANRLRGAGFPETDIAELLGAVGAGTPGRPWIAAGVADLQTRLRATADDRRRLARERLDSAEAIIPEYAARLGNGQEADAARLRAQLAPVLAADTLLALERSLDRERREAAITRAELERARARSGARAWFSNLREDLGLGLGWTGLYFTAFLALWRGQTPGKRAMRIRVVRLDAVPLGWWAAFERFGGYAAGFATGLLGFLQIFWDRNRQAVHDKISGTVVVQE